jgi:malate dehydrogenase
VLVVANPCNTNAAVAVHAALRHGRLSTHNFAAMLRLDHNRALFELAKKTRCPITSLRRLVVWGNHSSIVFPDDRFATADGRLVRDIVGDATWDTRTLVDTVDQRGGAILATRGAFAAASAGSAALDQMRDWWHGTGGEWTTMGVPSDGAYGVPPGLVFGFPVTVTDRRYEIVRGLPLGDFERAAIEANVRELEEELAVAKTALPALFA